MSSWLDPYKEKSSQEALRLIAQIGFSILLFIVGGCLLAYGLAKNNTVAISTGTGFIGTAVGTWIG